MTEKTYTIEEMKSQLDLGMKKFRHGMIGLIKECAVHRDYRDLTGRQALEKVAEKLGDL